MLLELLQLSIALNRRMRSERMRRIAGIVLERFTAQAGLKR